MTRVCALAWCMVLIVGAAGAAQAQSSDEVSRAKTHFEAARALYSLGKYESALGEFSSGYALVPKPRFLLNIGHCHRKLGQPDKAREAYARFLAEVPADDPDREEAQRYLAEVEKAATPVTPPPQVSAPPSVVVTPAPAPDKRSSKLKHLYWAIPVGAAVIVGVAVGAYYGSRPSVDCSGETLGCFMIMP
jgi:tetratricopeptide (TPR) repeat protein